MVGFIDYEPSGDLELMRKPREWPLALLPLVKAESGLKTGVLWSPSEGPGEGKKFYFLEDGNLFDKVRPPMEEWRSGGEELLLKLIEEGWVVD
jgi:hypothetical protein